MRQSCASLAPAKVERDIRPWKPCGRACGPTSAGKLLCLGGYPGKSAGRKPSPDIGPSKKSHAVEHHHRSAPRSDETRDPARSPATERKRFDPGSPAIV